MVRSVNMYPDMESCIECFLSGTDLAVSQEIPSWCGRILLLLAYPGEHQHKIDQRTILVASF